MKILIYIIFFFIGFARVFGACYMMKKVFRWKLRGYYLFSAGAGLMTMLCVIVPLLKEHRVGFNNYTLAAVFIPLIWFVVTDRSLKSLASAFSGYVFIDCVSMVLETAVNNTINFVGQKDEPHIIVLYISMLSSQIITIGAVVFIGRVGRSRMTEPMSVWNMLFMALLSYFSFELFMMFFAEVGNISNAEQLLRLVGISVFAEAFTLISVVMTVKFTESRYYSALNSINENYLNAQKDYYEMKQTSDNEIRRLRHDMKNHLICIRDLAAQGRYDELTEYLKEFSEAVYEADRLIHTGSGIIDAIVNEKAALARKLRIKFDWEGTVSGLNISAIDSCTLVSNLLDNAIEACEKVDVAKRYISLSFRRSEHFLLMTCENSAARVVELSNGRPMTSKSDRFNHGFGLGNIERCVEKYGGHLDLASYTEDDTPVFKAEAVIPLGQE